MGIFGQIHFCDGRLESTPSRNILDFEDEHDYENDLKNKNGGQLASPAV
jgi:hypothetical protein